MMIRLSAIALAITAGAFPVLADTFVVPPAYETAPGTAGFLGPLSTAQRTYQLLIHESELTAFAGQNITGFTFRSLASATAAWPTADMTWANYDIYLSPSVIPENRSFVFAENIAGPQIQVRNGPLTILAESFGVGSSPQPFGQVIEFNQPYAYAGGHLLVEIRHTGSVGTSRSVDAIGTAITGYGTQFRAIWAGNYVATETTSQGNFAILQFTASGGGICYANCDGSTVEPVLNVDDFTCFINEFAQAQTLPHEQQVTAYANCDGSTVAPALNVDDFTCFINQFAQGCP
jgi:hypothetical protein